MHTAPTASGAISPATFSSSTANGSAHKWRRICKGSSAWTSPLLTACIAASPRHTPLGVPVEPEVKVILAVPAGMATAWAGSRTSVSAWPATVVGWLGAAAQLAA